MEDFDKILTFEEALEKLDRGLILSSIIQNKKTIFIKKGENLDELSFDDAINFTQKAVFISGKSTEKYGAIASISDVII